MNIHIISFTRAGFSLSKRLQKALETQNACDSQSLPVISVDSASSASENPVSLSEWTRLHFQKGNCLVFVGAAGIAVRAVASFVKNKCEDAAVVVIDEKGRFVIPILSGHLGGANDIAKKSAELLGATSVITTASDVNNLTPIDEFAQKQNLAINDMNLAKEFAAKMLASSAEPSFPNAPRNEKNCRSEFSSESASEKPLFFISPYIKNDILNLIPRCVILGIGCKKGKSAEELQSFVCSVLEKHQIDYRSLEKIASIDLKKDEKAIVALSESLKRPFVTFSASELNHISQSVSHSDFVSEVTGTDNVCERAVFAAGAGKLLVPKTAFDGMTIAVGARKIEIEIPDDLKGCAKWE